MEVAVLMVAVALTEAAEQAAKRVQAVLMEAVVLVAPMGQAVLVELRVHMGVVVLTAQAELTEAVEQVA
jgi:hypothetical protein